MTFCWDEITGQNLKKNMRIPTVEFNCRSPLLFLPWFPWHQQCADFTRCQRHQLQHALKYLYNGGMCTWRWRVSCIQTFVVDPADPMRNDHGVNVFLENYLSTKLHRLHIDSKSCSLVPSDYLLLVILIHSQAFINYRESGMQKWWLLWPLFDFDG